MTKEEIEILREKQRKSGKEIGIKNLHPINTLDIEKQKEIRIKGAKATNEIRKKKKDIKTICSDLLGINALDIAKGIVDSDILEKLQNNDIDVTLYDLVVLKQIEKAISEKNVNSAIFLRDSSGDKPTDKIENNVNVITESDQMLLASIQDRLDSLESIETESKEV